MTPFNAGQGAPRHPDWDSRRLWSLWDMLKILGHKYLQLGGKLREAQMLLGVRQMEEVKGYQKGELTALMSFEHGDLGKVTIELTEICSALSLPISSDLLSGSKTAPVKTPGEFNILMRCIISELKTQLFLFVPGHRARYYERDVPWAASFPDAAGEARRGANAYAAGLYTACVYHCMRSLEWGLHALAGDVGLTPAKPLETMQWANIIDGIEAEIKKKREGKGMTSADPQIRFWSDAAAEFFVFKEAWRNQAMHIRADYDEPQAVRILDSVCEFMNRLSARLSG